MSKTNYSRRPRPVITSIRNENELAWTPVTTPLYSVVNGENVRAGESFAIVREGYERWPLGIVSDHYKVTDHNVTRRQILEGAGDRVTCIGALQAGHGYHVAHSYEIKHLRANSIDGASVSSRLVVAHDHTGKGALDAAMVVYVGNMAMGSIVRRRAIHVAMQPSNWSSEIDAMVEKSILAQDALLDLFVAMTARKLTETDREWLAKKGLKSRKGKTAETLFDALRYWYAGNTIASKMTWNVWARRLDDDALRIAIEMLGFAQYGTPLDEILGGRRYGRGHQLAAAANTNAA